MELPARKPNRIKVYDYSQAGAYFITICTHERKKLLSAISVGTAVPGCPQSSAHIQLLQHGEIADRYIRQMDAFYNHISVDNYVIMPDHIHLLLTVHGHDGQPGTAAPTGAARRNSVIAQFVRTFKRFCNQQYGENIWQRSYYDHVVHNKQDYDETWEYIEHNPMKWLVTTER